jgi:hypothetical protein
MLIKYWLKVDASQKQELWIKSALSEEICELYYKEIFCANPKLFTRLD